MEPVPLAVFGLYGDVLADWFDRRPLIRWCEAALGGCAVLLLVNALLPAPALWPLFTVTAVMMAAAALQRPSRDRRCEFRYLVRPAAPDARPAWGRRRQPLGPARDHRRAALRGPPPGPARLLPGPDLAAMIFAYPNALFRFLAAELHARCATGLMFAAPSAGAFGVTVVSGWIDRTRQHGLAIALSAAADMISGIFREAL